MKKKETKTQLSTIQFVLKVTGVPRVAQCVLFEMTLNGG